ncbi:hypothetical protein TrLO_g16014 [Triparma laevis f. longispina]|uniref:DNA-directed RNA polymerase RBP11-like dimerisation domain-containing protein n=1 Tax=Triparma laevis f. longispina TaxID=1714387 RepID=A0A9W7A7Z5_9STRA|nr:hypothetical protein TrLO_g16014 [Triparma laevis f. longispina]
MNAPERTAAFTLDEDNDERKITYAPSPQIPNAGTFTFNKEDHTMGNLIRHQLLRNPNVHFCGYMHPHPLIHRIDMKIQTRDGTTNPGDVLLEAIDDLTTECGKLQENFDGALELFQEEQDKGRNM